MSPRVATHWYQHGAVSSQNKNQLNLTQAELRVFIYETPVSSPFLPPFSQHVFSVDEKSKGVMETNQPTNRQNLGTFILGNFD